MRSYITPQTIANSVRMIRTQFSGAFLILEGDKDARFFRSYIEPKECKIVNAVNKDNAVQALIILEQEFFRGLLAIVDADFHFLEGKLPISQNLLFTDHHDLEIMLFNSQALEKVLTEYGSSEKIERFQEQYKKDVRTVLLEAGRIIGYLRWLSLQRDLSLDFEDLSYSKFIDEDKLEIDIPKLLKVVKNHSQKHDLDEIETLKELKALMSGTHDYLHVCCGHDLSAILSLALRRTLGTNNANEVKQEIIEKSLRLSFEIILFISTQLYESIRRWEQNNPGFRILRS